MSDDIEKINRLFRVNEDDAELAEDMEKPVEFSAEINTGKMRRTPIKAVDRLLIDSSGKEKRNYTGDEESERDFRPVRQSHEYRSGCLGGLMYFVFIACVSIVLACAAWMAASDMLALNQDNYTAVVTLPNTIFESQTVDTFDDNGKKTGTKRVTHADIDYVADVLKDAELIQYKWLFEAFCKVSKADVKVSPGEYELSSTYDYRALIQHMRAGSSSTITVMVTVPEGFSMEQIFNRLEEKGVCTYNSLMEAAASYNFNYDFLDESSVGDAKRLEGYLYPETYEFYVGMQASSAINKLLETYYHRRTAEMEARAEEMGMSMYDILTVASLIEKEAANDDERAYISSVIYNRLNRGMPLAIDASILYSYPDHEGAPTGTMLSADDPYNTRIYTGLPPTPICSPGLMSVTAALYPEYTDYIYYALDTESGEHRFFNNETEFTSFVDTQDYAQ